MHVYNKSQIEAFKFKFNGLETIERNYSQALQDMFVLSALSGKKNGTFLEIGAFDPEFISNTYLLEKFFGWSGISIDIEESCLNKFILSNRTAKFVRADATKLDYKEILKDADRIDYLSLDIEPNIQTLNCLKLLPLETCRFSVITFETDVYDKQPNSPYVLSESRRILLEAGYIRVCGNISEGDLSSPFEDWYLDSTIFSEDIIKNFMRLDDSTISAYQYLMF